MTSILPDISTTSRLSRAINSLKADAETTRIETVTGQFEDLTRAVDGDIGGVHLINKALNDVQNYQQSLSLAENRASRTQIILKSIAADTGGIGVDVLAAVGQEQSFAIETLSSESETTVRSVFGALNSSFEGRAVFGGDVTDRAPLTSADTLLGDVRAILAANPVPADADAALDAYFNDPAGGFATSIYRGGDNPAPAIEIAPGVRLNTSVQANDQAIKDMLRHLSVLANTDVIDGTNPDDRDAIISAAAGGALGTEKAIIDLQATLGVNESRIASTKNRYEEEERIFTNMLNERIARDPYEAASRLQLLETQLESSYILTSRLSRLTLANFL